MTFGGTAFELPPSAYIISNVAFTPSDTTTICLGAFSDIQVGLRKQTFFFYCSVPHTISHDAEQQTR